MVIALVLLAITGVVVINLFIVYTLWRFRLGGASGKFGGSDAR